MRIGTYPTSLGDISIGTLGGTLCSVEFGGTHLIKQRFGSHLEIADGQPDSIVVGKVILALEQGRDYDEPLSLIGTEFQKGVWHVLRKIPYGQTASYKEIAENIGRPKAVRAVANACAANAIAVIIPCHRVIRADGNDSGYRWGTDLKRKLLDKEYNLIHPMEIVLS